MLGRCRTAALAFAVVMLSATAWAQEIGRIASLEGTVEVGRAGAWRPAALGGVVGLGDEVRTAKPGRIRILLRDDSVLNVGPTSQIRIDEQVFDPATGNFRTRVHLLEGKLRVLVSEYYQQPKSVFEVETGTAVSAVRGTEFVIAYDPVAEVTEVVGVTNTVAVNSARGLVAHGVVVAPQHLTVVRKGQSPTAPTRLSDRSFRQYIEDLDFIGQGQAESAGLANPLVKGDAVLGADSADQLAGAALTPDALIGNRWSSIGVSPLPAGEGAPPRTGHEIEPDAGEPQGPGGGAADASAGGLGIDF